MEPFIFYLLAAITVGASLMVTLSRNAVNAAMYMILALIGTAGLFGLLGAYFLAALQVLVYAGAVMVLFVFIVMMIDVEEEAKTKLGVFNIIAALLAAGLMAAGIVGMVVSPEFQQSMPSLPESGATDPMVFSSSAKAYGVGLFGKFLLPIQVMGMLLLIAMVGVIVISKNLWSRISGDAEGTQQ